MCARAVLAPSLFFVPSAHSTANHEAAVWCTFSVGLGARQRARCLARLLVLPEECFRIRVRVDSDVTRGSLTGLQ